MSKKRYIDMKVDAKGRVTIQAHGLKGSECLTATKSLEAALGTVSDRQNLPEFYEKPMDVDQAISAGATL